MLFFEAMIFRVGVIFLWHSETLNLVNHFNEHEYVFQSSPQQHWCFRCPVLPRPFKSVLLFPSQVTQEICDLTRVFHLLGSDRSVQINDHYVYHGNLKTLSEPYLKQTRISICSPGCLRSVISILTDLDYTCSLRCCHQETNKHLSPAASGWFLFDGQSVN